MKHLDKTYRLLGIGMLSALILFISCQTDPDLEPDKSDNKDNNDNNGGDNSSGDIFTTDELSEFLVFTEAAKISGELPAASDGQIKIDVKDTIYFVKGYPLGDRIHFLKDPSQDISGYYIYVQGASFYYDVPETIEEGQYVPEGEEDTTSVVILDFDPPSDDISYPFTVEIKIQPHDPSGTPLDEFMKWITVEDPENDVNAQGGRTLASCNTITTSSADYWVWDFTIREYNGKILNVMAPGLAKPINSQGGGCCNTRDGTSVTTSDPILECSPIDSLRTPYLSWIQLDVSDFLVRLYEYLYIREDLSATVSSREVKLVYNRATTNFCSGVVGYTGENNRYFNDGSHDFTPGASYIDFDFPSWNGPYRISDGDLIYTCNTLIIHWGIDDNFYSVYRRFRGVPDLITFYN